MLQLVTETEKEPPASTFNPYIMKYKNYISITIIYHSSPD